MHNVFSVDSRRTWSVSRRRQRALNCVSRGRSGLALPCSLSRGSSREQRMTRSYARTVYAPPFLVAQWSLVYLRRMNRVRHLNPVDGHELR